MSDSLSIFLDKETLFGSENLYGSFGCGFLVQMHVFVNLILFIFAVFLQGRSVQWKCEAAHRSVHVLETRQHRCQHRNIGTYLMLLVSLEPDLFFQGRHDVRAVPTVIRLTGYFLKWILLTVELSFFLEFLGRFCSRKSNRHLVGEIFTKYLSSTGWHFEYRVSSSQRHA